MGAMGGSGLFKFQNPLPALSNLFKRPSSSSFDPMNGPGPDSNGPPPISAFVHRPVGPESSHYNRANRPSPASGSSSPASKKSTKSKAKGKKAKTGLGTKL